MKNWQKAGLFLLALGALGFIGNKFWNGFKSGWGYNRNYSPKQPIPFDHSLHVGTNQIQCQYCHNQVERAPFSNIPALSTCMNCHLLVKAQSPHIQELHRLYNSGESIAWKKIHMLPDFVKYDHSAHIQKGVNCQTCHGPVETMTQMYQFSDLSMGWCVNCHRDPKYNAPTDCNTCHH